MLYLQVAEAKLTKGTDPPQFPKETQKGKLIKLKVQVNSRRQLVKSLVVREKKRSNSGVVQTIESAKNNRVIKTSSRAKRKWMKRNAQ
jgi:hypothetical protein